MNRGISEEVCKYCGCTPVKYDQMCDDCWSDRNITKIDCAAFKYIEKRNEKYVGFWGINYNP